MWQWGISEAAGRDTLEAVAVNLHEGGSDSKLEPR